MPTANEVYEIEAGILRGLAAELSERADAYAHQRQPAMAELAAILAAEYRTRALRARAEVTAGSDSAPDEGYVRLFLVLGEARTKRDAWIGLYGPLGPFGTPYPRWVGRTLDEILDAYAAIGGQ